MLVAVISSLGAPLVPAIADAEGVSLSNAQWSLTITLVTGAVATPVIGRLGDSRWRRQVVITVLAAVVVGNLLAALPLGLSWLLVGRALQGLGLGLTPVAIATARDALSGQRSVSAVAALSVTTVAGMGLGYPLTGLIAEVGGVRAAFWFGAGASLLALLGTVRVFPPSPDVPSRSLDFTGAVLLGVGLAAALLVLSEGEAWGWTSTPLLLLALLSLIAGAGWVLWELRSAAPLVDVRLALRRKAATAHAAALLAGLGMYLLVASVARLAQTPTTTGYGFGATVVVAGLILVPFSLASMAAGRLIRLLPAHLGPRAVLGSSSTLLAAAMGVFGSTRGSLWQLFLVMAIAGLGVGGAFAALPGLIVSAVPHAETGSAMSFNQVLRYVGYATGSALSATLLEAATPLGERLPRADGYTTVAIAGALVCAAMAIITWVLPGPSDRPPA
jgi:MFS family permease